MMRRVMAEEKRTEEKISFEGLTGSPWKEALESLGFVRPLPVQAAAIPRLREGSAYLSAETGSGKTLAYLLPVLEGIDPEKAAVQAVILAPTRELASQVVTEARRLTQAAGAPIRSLLLIGGANLNRQIEGLKKKPHLVVGAVGRMIELLERHKLKLRAVSTVVVDEADRLLSGEETAALLERFARALPPEARWIFVSASVTPDALSAARRLAPDLRELFLGENRVSASVRHLFTVTEPRKKADLLRRFFHALAPRKSIVFVHRAKDAELLRHKMNHYRIPVADLHGARGKQARTRALAALRKGEVRLLIASDLGARGIDVEGVDCVFNYDAPASGLDYLHRAGRTGRAGRPGLAVTFITGRERNRIRRYERELGIRLEEVEVREGKVFRVEDGEVIG